MGFLDKVKNMFTEEVEDEVEVQPIKKEVTHVEIESPVAHNEADDVEDFAVDYSFKSEDTRPIFFDESDFKDLDLTDDKDDFNFNYDDYEIKKDKYEEPVKEKYEPKVEVKEELVEKKVFKPTPIISPVYGILDKNYHKEDIVSRNDAKIEETDKEPSIDSIRDKAYGTLEDELENTLFGTNSILFKNNDNDNDKEEVKVREIDDDAITNLTNDISKELDELLLKKEQYVEEPKHKSKEESVEEIEKEEIEDDDLLGFIDSTLYKEGDE